jgi:hypothetical protein
MSKDTRHKGATVFLVASNDSLFFTTGAYILFELCKDFNVVLFVNRSLKSNSRFSELCKYCKIEKIVLLPNLSKLLPIKAIYLYILYRKILRKYKPELIIQNNFSNLENSYLFFLSKMCKNVSFNIVYLNGQQRIENEEKVRSIYKRESAEKASKKLKINLKFLILFYSLRSSVYKYLIFYIIPLLLSGRKPYSFSLKYNFHKKKKSSLFDSMLVYKSIEKKCINDILDFKEDVVQVVPSVVTVGQECNKILHPHCSQSKTMLFCPSSIGFYSFSEDKKGIDIWIEAINIICLESGDYDHLFKLHPRTKKNKDYIRIVQYISDKCKCLKIIDASNNIEGLVIKSEVIISDVSSVLWWSSAFPEKFPISLDFNRFYGSNHMKKYNNILYINSFKKLKDIKINDLLVVAKNNHYEVQSNLKISSYCKSIVNKNRKNLCLENML